MVIYKVICMVTCMVIYEENCSEEATECLATEFLFAVAPAPGLDLYWKDVGLDTLM